MGKLIKSLQWTTAFLLLCYIVYRACSISITQDEAYTYFLVKTNYWRAMPGTANTHWLNSIMLRLFLWLPGPDDPWKLRLLSMMSWCLYAYSVIRLGDHFKNRFLALAFFAAAMLNPFVVFYFSLSRGYAAAFALVMFCLLQAARVLERGETAPEKWMRVFIPASLAVLANFSVFYFYMALTLVYLIHLVGKRQIRLLKDRSSFRWIVLVIVTFGFSISALLFIRHTGDLEFGGRSDVRNALFLSLVETSLYIPVARSVVTTATAFFIISFLFLFIGAVIKHSRTKELTWAILSIYCWAGIVLLNVLLHTLFGVPYLLERTALIVYITLLPGFFGMIDWAGIKKWSVVSLQAAVCGVIIFFFSYNFYSSYNTKFFPEWTMQADTEKGLDYLTKKRATNIGMGVWHWAVFHNYYEQAFPGKYPFKAAYIKPGEIRKPADTAKLAAFDYLFLDGPGTATLLYLENWKQEMFYPDSDARIYSRKL